jgi:hypothetical protein
MPRRAKVTHTALLAKREDAFRQLDAIKNAHRRPDTSLALAASCSTKTVQLWRKARAGHDMPTEYIAELKATSPPAKPKIPAIEHARKWISRCSADERAVLRDEMQRWWETEA